MPKLRRVSFDRRGPLAKAADSELDRAELLRHVAVAQAGLVGDEAAADAKR